jgi:hypothetical protein
MIFEAKRREAKLEAQSRVPRAAYSQKLDILDLSPKVMSNLLRNGLTNVGEVMERMAQGDEALLMLDGVGVKALRDINRAVENSQFSFIVEEVEPEFAEPTEAETVAEAADAVVEAADESVEVVTEVEELEDVAVAAEAETVIGEVEPVATVTEDVEEMGVAEEVTDEAMSPAEETVVLETTAEAETVEAELPTEPEADPEPELANLFKAEAFDNVAVSYDTFEEDEELEGDDTESKKRRKRKKGRTVLFDEDSGETYVVRKRRRRQQNAWDDFDDDF